MHRRPHFDTSQRHRSLLIVPLVSHSAAAGRVRCSSARSLLPSSKDAESLRSAQFHFHSIPLFLSFFLSFFPPRLQNAMQTCVDLLYLGRGRRFAMPLAALQTQLTRTWKLGYGSHYEFVFNMREVFLPPNECPFTANVQNMPLESASWAEVWLFLSGGRSRARAAIPSAASFQHFCGPLPRFLSR